MDKRKKNEIRVILYFYRNNLINLYIITTSNQQMIYPHSIKVMQPSHKG